jgi:transcriptional regulator
MYSPEFYRDDRLELILPLIREYGFATLMSIGAEGISHLPFVVEELEGKIELLSHMARANPHWKELSSIGKAKIIFQGPHAYVSPGWYVDAPGNVPTWNYAVVHATGDFVIVDEQQAALSAMDTLVGTFETKYGTGWQIPRTDQAADEIITGLMKGIVVFRITNLKFEAKFKLSQKHTLQNRKNVIAALSKSKSEDAQKTAELMKQTLPKDLTREV